MPFGQCGSKPCSVLQSWIQERFTARNVTEVTPDPDPLPPPLNVTHKWAATKQRYLAPHKTVLLKGCSDPPAPSYVSQASILGVLMKQSQRVLMAF